MSALNEAWQSIKQIEFSLGEMESNPQIVQIVPPNEVVVVIAFEIKMTSRAGTMNLCIPFNSIERLILHSCNRPFKLRTNAHSTVTLFARFRGLSTSVPFTSAA